MKNDLEKGDLCQSIAELRALEDRVFIGTTLDPKRQGPF